MKNYIERVLSDTRNCRSNNMQKFFRRIRNRSYFEVIRWHKDNELYFVTLGWRTHSGDNGFSGCSVREVACYGNKSILGYPCTQTGDDYSIVTDWFWNKYFSEGMYGHFEIWHKTKPLELSHAEHHTI